MRFAVAGNSIGTITDEFAGLYYMPAASSAYRLPAHRSKRFFRSSRCFFALSVAHFVPSCLGIRRVLCKEEGMCEVSVSGTKTKRGDEIFIASFVGMSAAIVV